MRTNNRVALGSSSNVLESYIDALRCEIFLKDHRTPMSRAIIDIQCDSFKRLLNIQ